MKKRNVILLIIAAFLTVVLVIGYQYYQKAVSSPLSPVISFDEQVLFASVNATDEDLLQGVTATDPEDGDVTDSLMVECSSNLVNENAVKVTYVAFDSKNHMCRAERTVRYTDYKPPEFSLTRPMVFKASSTIDILNYINAEDVFDGDISRKVIYELMGSSTTVAAVGEHDVELRVTNSKGDTSHLALSVEVAQNDPNAANIQLKQYLVYVPVGSSFSAENYFKSYESGGELVTEARSVRITSDVDTETAGTYTVTYSIGYGNNESHTRLIVVVE
ncbi:MAG: DUF5011 domain-containing protein [Bacillota bacterium]|nr:DUF5011 domain-containing protein [Bacillota bacterium]